MTITDSQVRRVDRLMTALRQRYGTPARVLTALGMDTNILKDNTMRNRTRRTARDVRIYPAAYDADENEVAPSEVSSDELVKAVAAAFVDMDPRTAAEALEKFKELTDSGDPLMWAEGVLGNGGESESDTTGDEPPEFPGRPTPGEQPRRLGQDARRPRAYTIAQDADFARRFPGAARIGRNGL